MMKEGRVKLTVLSSAKVFTTKTQRIFRRRVLRVVVFKSIQKLNSFSPQRHNEHNEFSGGAGQRPAASRSR